MAVEVQRINDTTVYEFEGKFHVVTELFDVVAIGGEPLIFIPPEVWKAMKESPTRSSGPFLVAKGRTV